MRQHDTYREEGDDPHSSEGMYTEQAQDPGGNAKGRYKAVLDQCQRLSIDTDKHLKEATEKFGDFEDQFMDIKRDFTIMRGEFVDLQERLMASENRFKSKADVNQVFRTVDHQRRIDDRVTQIQEEIGFGEDLNVSKIPPGILEVVYQSTIDDIVKQMWMVLGTHDAEHAMVTSLEELRNRTSGSELFRFDGRRIVTRDFVKSIEHNLISAKQIQMTYQELLNRLLEYVPGYKAKNFKAMIKVKSQEYAVDKVTFLIHHIDDLQMTITNIKTEVKNITMEVRRSIVDMEESIEEAREELDGFMKRMDSVDDTVTELRTETEKALEELPQLSEKIREAFSGELKDGILGEVASKVDEHLGGLSEKDEELNGRIDENASLIQLMLGAQKTITDTVSEMKGASPPTKDELMGDVQEMVSKRLDETMGKTRSDIEEQLKVAMLTSVNSMIQDSINERMVELEGLVKLEVERKLAALSSFGVGRPGAEPPDRDLTDKGSRDGGSSGEGGGGQGASARTGPGPASDEDEILEQLAQKDYTSLGLSRKVGMRKNEVEELLKGMLEAGTVTSETRGTSVYYSRVSDE